MHYNHGQPRGIIVCTKFYKHVRSRKIVAIGILHSFSLHEQTEILLLKQGLVRHDLPKLLQLWSNLLYFTL